MNNKRAFHVFSDQDIKIFNADNMALFYNYEDYFYEVPEVCKPENCGMYSTDFYAINAGKVIQFMVCHRIAECWDMRNRDCMKCTLIW